MKKFDVQLLDQYWINGSRDPEGYPEDVTSHGKIELIVNGTDISGCDNEDTDYGINQSAVQLLHSIFVDHTPSTNYPMIYHGCTIIGTCPNCLIDFRVKHLDNEIVMLDKFSRVDGSDKKEPFQSWDILVQVPRKEYAQKILDFAKIAFDFLPSTKPGDDWDVREYNRLWALHKRLIELTEEYIHTGAVTDNIIEYAIANKPSYG